MLLTTETIGQTKKKTTVSDSVSSKQQPQTSHHIVIFRFQRQTFEQDATPEEAQIVKDHLQYLKDLHAQGKRPIQKSFELTQLKLIRIESLTF